MSSNKPDLRKQVAKLKGVRVAVLGDLMLDEHLWCEVTRISPEAPVPIARVKSVTHVPGGAANVASNIAALGGVPLLFGLAGQDSSGERLLHALDERGIDTNYILRTQNRPTILKSRVIAHQQHVVRVDREHTEAIRPETEQRVLESFARVLSSVGAVLISDYHKGFLTERLTAGLIQMSRKAGVPVLVDPKGASWTKYKHATVLTPNRAEAETAAKEKLNDRHSLRFVAEKLIKQLDLSYLLVTLSEQGMTLFPRKGAPAHVDALAKEVYDITGAGDTVISTLALAMAEGWPIIKAMTLANVAASIVVAKVGTAAVTLLELERQLSKLSAKNLEVKRETTVRA